MTSEELEDALNPFLIGIMFTRSYSGGRAATSDAFEVFCLKNLFSWLEDGALEVVVATSQYVPIP